MTSLEQKTLGECMTIKTNILAVVFARVNRLAAQCEELAKGAGNDFQEMMCKGTLREALVTAGAEATEYCKEIMASAPAAWQYRERWDPGDPLAAPEDGWSDWKLDTDPDSSRPAARDGFLYEYRPLVVLP